MAKGVNYWDGSQWLEVAGVRQSDGQTAPVYRYDGSQFVKIFPSGPTVLEDFEHNDLAGKYSGDTGSFDITSTSSLVDEGTYALDVPGDPQASTLISRTDKTVGRDETLKFRFRLDAAETSSNEIGVAWFAQSATGFSSFSGYFMSINVDSDNPENIRLYRVDSGTSTKLTEATVSEVDQTYRDCLVHLGLDGYLEGRVYDGNGNLDAAVNTIDRTYSTGGFGWYTFGGDAQADYLTTRRTGTLDNVRNGLTGWSKDSNNPVLTDGASGSWDERRVFAPSLYEDDAGTYHLFYSGDDANGNAATGHATSADLVSWTKDSSNPVFTSSNTHNGGNPTSPSIVTDGSGTFYLFYHAFNSGTDSVTVGVTSSTSLGGDWTNTGTEIITPGASGSWDENSTFGPGAAYYNGTWYCLYEGNDSGGTSQVGLATSTNSDPTVGADWSKTSANPVVTNGPNGTWEYTDAAQPSLLIDGDRFHCFYEGTPDGNTTLFIGHAAVDAGSATSTKWEKNRQSPLLVPSASGWDSANVSQPTPIIDSSTEWEMLYMGNSDNSDHTTWDIGRATLSL